MGKRVVIDEEECIGCGTCEEICPEVFKLNPDTEKAEVIKPEGGPEDPGRHGYGTGGRHPAGRRRPQGPGPDDLRPPGAG